MSPPAHYELFTIMYAIIDLESTGGKYNEEGITEIAVYKFDGQEIVDQFSCLVNPEREIQPFVVKLTGINNTMLRHAPKFHEIAKRVVEITEDCVIVAHNAKFDYRLLRTEFSRLGYDFKRNTLCTVELSKRLIPGLPSYSLGKLVKNLGIPLTDRHRAIGDARATVKLFKLLLSKDTDKSIVSKHIQRKPHHNRGKALVKITESLPTKTGVYYIHNEKGQIIYIGKSRNIKSRISQHFSKKNQKSKQIQQEANSVSYDLTGNELIALLKENEEIKKLKPIYNHTSKKDLFQYALYADKDQRGYLNLKLAKTKPAKKHITSFTNLSQGKKALEKMVDSFDLCLKLTGLHRVQGACFNYTIKKCHGACIQQESSEQYNKRVEQLIEQHSFDHKNRILVGPGRKPSEKSALLIEQGKFKGIAYFDLNFQMNSPEIIRHLLTPMSDNRDARHIIQSQLRKANPFKSVPF